MKKTFITAAVIFLLGSGAASATLIAGENTRSGPAIRQEKKVMGAVLVSKPAALDVKIADIIDCRSIASIEDYEKWLQKNISYRKDRGREARADPDETLSRKYGDCKDFAFLNMAALRVLGYKSEVMIVSDSSLKRGHAICVFERNGEYLLFDNQRLIRSGTGSREEFLAYLGKFGYICRQSIKTEK